MPEQTGVCVTLTGPIGHTVHADDFRGKVTLLFFGYTHCPDVCPLTLATLAQTLRQLGDEANDINVLFVSVDPVRDSGRVVSDFARAFGPRFVGLTGTPEQLQTLAKRYSVAFTLDKPDAQGNYNVAHSSGVFIFDRKGKARVLGRQRDGVKPFTHDLQLLVADVS